ncbi:MAG: RNA methyltransferase [Flavobacteriaceae bacterium]
MLSKSQIKLITSLQQKKYRTKYKLFVVEGKKSVLEFLKSNYELEILYATESFVNPMPNLKEDKEYIITNNELKKISSLKNPTEILAVFRLSEKKHTVESDLTLVLDAVQDPGNLGTIIRLCDWFGIKSIVCSPTTVDCYNPKVVQATMGSLTRVSVVYTDLETYLTNTTLPIYASLLDGENIYKTKLPKKALIIMGNEGKGISKELIALATNSLNIPHFGEQQDTESLNVATATAVLLSEFCRGK